MIWKLTLMAWVLTLFAGRIMNASMTPEEKVRARFAKNKKPIPMMIYMVLNMVAMIMTIASLVWLLFIW